VQINISARHGELSAATQEKISEKVQRLPKFFDRLTAIQVTVDLEHRDKPGVELRVKAEHADDFIAFDTDENLLAALDSVLHKVEKQLRKHKEKVTEHRVAGHRHTEAPAAVEPEGE
jgi:putative sigma-54 modulation protein